MKKLELELIEEINAKKEDTFMYQLHELSIFDESKLNNLLNISNKYLDNISQSDKQYIFIVKGLFKLFLHTFFLLHCNDSSEDLYKIKNYSNTLNEDKISDLYFQMREIISKIK